MAEALIVKDLLGSTLGYIDDYTGLKVSYKMDSWSELSFSVPAIPRFRKLLQNELYVVYKREPFVIKGVDPDRASDGAPTLSVKAPLNAIELNQKLRQVVGTYIGAEIYSNWIPNHPYKKYDRIKYYGIVYECQTNHLSGSQLAGSQWVYWSTCSFQAELAEIVLSATDMMNLALANTGWTPGIIDDDGSTRTFSGEWLSVPQLLSDMCDKFDKHVIYHGETKIVDFVTEPGRDDHVTLEYGKNLSGISKSADSTDFVTKMFVYGDEDLTFNDVNLHGAEEHPLYQLQNLQSYILNFDYYLSQGYTLNQIYASWQSLGDSSPFFKIGKLTMTDYIDGAVMLADSKKKFKESYAFPQVTYRASFLYLAEMLEGCQETLGVGDWVTVRDKELGVDVKVRVTSLDLTPGFPEDCSCELSNKDDFFGEAVASSLAYSQKLSNNGAVNNLMKRYINTVTTAINSSTGNLIWKEGQLTAVELDANGTPTGNQVRLTPSGFGVSTNFGVSYDNAITGAGVLANKVVADSIHVLSVGSDGILIEPQSTGVRLNNTEGIVVQSQDKRFCARIKASNEMGGTSQAFGLYNGDFTEPTIINEGGYFKIDSTVTTIPYNTVYTKEVGANGHWYLITGGVAHDTGLTAEYTGDSLVFGVNMNGDAYFKGEVQATSGSFTGAVYASEGSFTGDLNAGSLKVNGVDLLHFISAATSGENESMDMSGDITIGGSLTLGGNINITGNINWGNNSPTQCLYSRTQLSAPNGNYDIFPDSSSTGWHKVLDSSDYYGSYTYNAGASWSAAVQIRGINGTNGTNGADGSDANVPTYIRQTFIDFSRVQSPTIVANEVQTLGTFQVGYGSVSGDTVSFTPKGYMGAAQGLDANNNTTYGVALSTTLPLTSGNYVIVTDSGVRMQAGSHRLTVTANGAYVDGNLIQAGTTAAVFG